MSTCRFFQRHSSTILGSIVPFTSRRKNRTEDKLKIQTIHKLNTTQKKQTTQNKAKQNYSSLVAFCDTRPGNKVGLFYNPPEPTADVDSTHTMLAVNKL